MNQEIYVGHIIDVMWLPSHDAYIIEKDLKEYLIPIVPEIIKKVDYDNRKYYYKSYRWIV